MTNVIQNSTNVGAVVGTPGTLPTLPNTGIYSAWNLLGGAGCTISVVGFGTTAGLPYIDISVSGTCTSGYVQIVFNAAYASASLPWTISAYLAVTAGSLSTNITNASLIYDTYSGTIQSVSSITYDKAIATVSPTGTLTRFSAEATTDAGTTVIIPYIYLTTSTTAPISFTLRIAGVQLEQASAPTAFVPTPTGWSQINFSGGWTLSGAGNTVATGGSGGGILSAVGHASGLYYFEATVAGSALGASNPVIGICGAAFSLTTQPGNSGTDSLGFQPQDVQEVRSNGSIVGSNHPSAAATSNEVFSFCVDLNNGKFYVLDADYISAFGATAWNGLSTANPAANIGGISFSFSESPVFICAYNNASGPIVSLNTGQTGFLRSPPAGFSAWDFWGSTIWTDQGFFFPSGSFSGSASIRHTVQAGSNAYTGTSSFAGIASQIQHASASLAGSGGMNWSGQNLAVLVTAPTSSDTSNVSLAGATASLVTTSTSADSGTASLTVPSIAANTQFLQNALIDAFLRGQPFVPPATWYVALVTAFGSTTTPGTEVSGAGYARVPIAASLVNWSGTQGAGTTAASIGTSGLSSNNSAIQYAAPTSNWGTIVGYEFWDSMSGGNRWFAGALVNPLAILNGGAARAFAAGALTVSIG